MRILLISLVLMCAPLWVNAQNTEVDVELFLAVDVSRSMSAQERDIQRRGYADALTSDAVQRALRSGLLGRIAVTYVEWAGEYDQRVIVPWHLMAGPEDAGKIAEIILDTEDAGLRRTSISGALSYAINSFENNIFKGLRRVIDVSGDGPNNQGKPVTPARDRALAAGFIINGLPLMTQDALSEIWGIPDLDDYYTHCVIGGPGAFVIPVLSWDQFADAVKRKLVLEIADRPPPAALDRVHKASTYDCLVGEKMWEQNRSFFDIP